jgi:hypothetical protein
MIKIKKAVSEVLPSLALAACIGIFTFSLTPNLNESVRYTGIFVSGMIPIALYHYVLILQRSTKVGKTHLTDAEIDSVYYFGFVITLITLIAAVFTLGTATSDEINPKTIGIQFGLGLFVTGYALIGRLHLQVTNEADLEPEDAYANYVDRVNSLLGRVDLAYADLDELLKRLVDRLRTTLETESRENSSRINRQVEDSFAPLLAACQQLASQIGEDGLRNDIESMRTVVTSTNRTFKTFDTRLQTLSDQTEQSTQPIAKLGDALAACERGSSELASVLNSLTIDSSISQSLNESVGAISTVFKNFSAAVQRLEHDFGTNSQQSSSAFRQFNESLVTSTQLLSQSMNQLALAMAESSKTLSSSIREATSNETEK